MGKVYAKALRQVEEELERDGFVSVETRHQANLVQPVDLSAYPIRTIFENFSGISTSKVSDLRRIWQTKIASSSVDILLSRADYTKLLALGTDVPVNNDEGKVLAQQQFKAFARGARHMNILDFFGGLALQSDGLLDAKALLIFSLIDLKRQKSLCRDDVVLVTDACLRGLSCLKEDLPAPDMEGVEWIVNRAFNQYMGSLRARMPSRVFLAWCRFDATIESALKKSNVANDLELERAIERKLLEQKKLLQKLAKIEHQLQTTYLLPRFDHNHVFNSVNSSHRPQGEDPGEREVVTKATNLPVVAPYEDGSESLEAVEVRGLTTKLYDLMNEQERLHWRDASNTLWKIYESITCILGSGNCSIPTDVLLSMVKHCSLGMKDTSIDTDNTETDARSFFEWVSSWTLPLAVVAETACDEVRNFWCWMRVIIPAFTFIFYAGSALISNRLDQLSHAMHSAKVLCEKGECRRTTSATVRVKSPHTLSTHFTVVYDSQGVEVKTGFYDNIEKEFVTEEEKANLSEYALHRLNRRLALRIKGAEVYERIVLDQRGHIPSSDGNISAYVLVEFAMNIQATTSMRIHFLNTLNILFQHPYWHKGSLVEGVFAQEVAEFKGSAPRIRVVFFLSDNALPYIERIEKLHSILPTVYRFQAKVSVEPIFWDILAGSLWKGEAASLFGDEAEENTAFSELGEQCLQELFDSFADKKSRELGLDEMNALLRCTGNDELRDMKEYRAIISEERLQSNNWRVTVDGLKRLYSRSPQGDLAADAAMVGIGGCSLASCGVEFHLDVEHSYETPPCSTPLDCFKSEGTIQHILLKHSKQLAVDWEYARWKDVPDTWIKAVPQLAEFLFSPGFAHDKYSSAWAAFRSLKHSLRRAMEEHVESKLFDLAKSKRKTAPEDTEGDNEEEEKLMAELDEESSASEDYYESEGDTALEADYKMRGFLRLLHNVIDAGEGVVAGVSTIHLRLRGNQSVIFSVD